MSFGQITAEEENFSAKDLSYQYSDEYYRMLEEAYGVKDAETLLDEIRSKNSNGNISVSGFADWFYGTEWLNRSNGLTLSINAKTNWIDGASNGNELMMRASQAWNDLYCQQYRDYRWGNTASMEAQFHCHVLTVPHKNRWNIEPWRTESDLDRVIAAACNP